MERAQRVVLVVDDDLIIRETLQELLGDAGYTVETAADGASGLARIEAGGVGVVLLDLMLPEVDGYEVCRRVRQQESGTYLPILMLTSLAQAAQRHRGFEAGADDYITKPFDAEVLLERVAVWVRTRERLERLEAERREKARLEGALLAARTAQHEVSNQLTVTVGWADLLLSDPTLPPRVREQASQIASAAREAVRLLDRLQHLTHLPEIQWGPNLGPTIDLSEGME